ncbi:bifunctional sulfate adenylyltransferase/adenylylsulfate kinase [Candidatus Kaiserbacteria bacterium]|nr:bifunctional sulfate adenylyltransferase/adenylylsulfate kinase [Candidatus Kaiserbacteria bacterium]
MRKDLENSNIARLPRLTLTARQLADLDQILVGGFAPLTGFLEEKDYKSVVENMRLANGTLWPIPIVLDVSRDHGRKKGEKIILCDQFGNPIAFFTVTSIYEPDKEKEARLVYGTENIEHAGVKYLFEDTGDVYLGGPVELIAYAPVYDFKELRFTPQDLKAHFKKKKQKKILAFQTRNPIHRGHFEAIKRAAKESGAHVLIHPVVGPTKEGDIDYISRVRSYVRLVQSRMKDFATLALLPIAMRMAGPREALWHAIIRKNYGATHFIVGRDHAGLRDLSGKSFYGVHDSLNTAKKLETELGISIVPMKELAYVEKEDLYLASDELKPHHKTKILSGSDFRKMLYAGEPIPTWFAFPEVVAELKKAMEKTRRLGAVIFFTGLSGAGKSTMAHMLYHKLLESYDRSVTLLDGDVVRQNLSKGLTFSRADRDENIKRIGYVASEIAKHGGIAICAAIAPFKGAREHNRKLIAKNGTYIEIYVSTPIAVCEKRDRKGLYKKARAGLLKGFTGIDDPYEIPKHPELTLDTSKMTSEKSVEKIIDLLKRQDII